ncbi:hypothetical protein L7F22_013893 [Adiantum nelumboides]|nr:hypothetical protein [Adiantum nelumboides]
MRYPDEQASESTCIRGTLIDRAIELGRSRRPRLQGSSRHRWRLHQGVRTVLARHGRRSLRVLTKEDIGELRQRIDVGYRRILFPTLQPSISFHFIPFHFSSIQFQSKSKTFSWEEAQRRSFEWLKVAVATAPILAIVDPLNPFVVETDASDKAIDAVLLQEGRPIAFESKKLDRAQQNYSVYERELYAIVHALRKWRHYLYGAEFEVGFDNKSIKWFTTQADLKGRKARWAEILQDYDCKLQYRKGRYNVVADALSRMPQINSLQPVGGLAQLTTSYQLTLKHTF